MLNRVSNWQVGQWFDSIQSGGSFLGLLQSEPTEADISSVECYGDGYRRQIVSWTRRGRSLILATECRFSGLALPMGVAGVGVFTTQRGSTVRATGLLEEKVTLVTTSAFTLGRGEIVLTVA